MQRALGRARFLRRHQLGPREIELQELVGDDERPCSSLSSSRWPEETQKSIMAAPCRRFHHADEIDLLDLRARRHRRPRADADRLHAALRERVAAGLQRRLDRAEPLAHRAVGLDRALQRDHRAERMIRQRGRERDLLVRRRARSLEIGRAMLVDQMLGAAPPSPPRRRLGRRLRHLRPASTSRTSRARGSPSGTPPAPCRRASRDRRPRT